MFYRTSRLQLVAEINAMRQALGWVRKSFAGVPTASLEFVHRSLLVRVESEFAPLEWN